MLESLHELNHWMKSVYVTEITTKDLNIYVDMCLYVLLYVGVCGCVSFEYSEKGWAS